MSGRYAEAKYGEQPVVVATFLPGDTVTISVLDLATDTLLSITPPADDCNESAVMGGIFYWDTANLDAQPVDFNQLVFRMENAAGLQRPGKIVIGGFPSNSAKDRFSNGYVYIDTGSAFSGTGFPNGTETQPVNNITDADTIAGNEGLNKFMLRGTVTLTTDHENWSLDGYNPATDIYTVQSPASVDGSRFERSGILGDLSGDIVATECFVGNAVSTTTGISGTFTECGFDGIIQLVTAGTFQGLRLSSRSASIAAPACILDCNNVPSTVLGIFTGLWRVRNCNQAMPIAFGLDRAQLTLESSVTAGIWLLLGDGEIVDNKTGAGSFEDYVRRGSRQNQVWDGTIGTRVVDQTTDPNQWKLRVKKGDDDSTNSHSFDLVDGNGNPISDSNDLGDFVAERNRI
jgi:hypothetical protein